MSAEKQVRLHTTKDGSHSLYSEHYGQFYHNPNGALAESIHVFFDQSDILEKLRTHQPIRVFEVGFGTGLNLHLLADLAQKAQSRSSIHFESVEAWPVSQEIAAGFNYGELTGNLGVNQSIISIFEQIQKRTKVQVQVDSVEATIHKCRFDELLPEPGLFTHIFHDPFSPEVNGELWTPEVFEKHRQWSTNDAVLATYCAASKARAAMAVAGWFVARAPGALGKREMTVASLSSEKLDGFQRLNEKRLAERWKKGDFDR